MSLIIVGTSGIGSVEMAKKYEEAVIVTRTTGSTILEFAQALKDAIIENPEAIIVADDVTNETMPGELLRKPLMRETEPYILKNFEEQIKTRNYEPIFRAPKNTYNKYQKGRDKRNK